jgi:CheY-like chemotaxis protein
MKKETHSKKILVVDDEEDIRTSLQTLLEASGYQVQTANNGKSALQILRKENFDLVITDLLMPDMSGRELAEKIRANPKWKGQKIAFLSVIGLSETGAKQVKELGPVYYFQKPIDIHVLRKELKKIIGQ